MGELAHRLKAQLQNNRLDAFGEIIHEGWRLKKQMADGISTSLIDDWYGRVRKAGAIGGKLLGAGTGGFRMFYPPGAARGDCARAW